eukprot:gene21293-biopygen30014
MFKSGYFNQPDLADLCLVLRSGSCTSSDLTKNDSLPAKRRRIELFLDDERSFYTHKVILASKSPVIKAMLLRAKELRDIQTECDTSVGQPKKGRKKRSAGRGSGSIPPTHQLPDLQLETLELPVEQEELLACEVLFRSIYSDNLAEEVRSALSSEQGAGVNRTTLLMQVYRLADRLEVCTDQCACAISSLSSADLESVHAVNYIFSWKRAAPALVEHAIIKAVLERCVSHLVARFGVLRMVHRGSPLLEKFKRLDFLTVLSFFDSDKLKVVSENEVIVLMGLWMGDLAKLLTAVQHAGAQEDLHIVRARLTTFNGYDIVPTLSVQIVPVGSRKTFVVSVGFELKTSAAYMSASIQPLPLALVKADCLLGKGTVFKGSVDALLLNQSIMNEDSVQMNMWTVDNIAVQLMASNTADDWPTCSI